MNRKHFFLLIALFITATRAGNDYNFTCVENLKLKYNGLYFKVDHKGLAVEFMGQSFKTMLYDSAAKSNISDPVIPAKSATIDNSSKNNVSTATSGVQSSTNSSSDQQRSSEQTSSSRDKPESLLASITAPSSDNRSGSNNTYDQGLLLQSQNIKLPMQAFLKTNIFTNLPKKLKNVRVLTESSSTTSINKNITFNNGESSDNNITILSKNAIGDQNASARPERELLTLKDTPAIEDLYVQFTLTQKLNYMDNNQLEVYGNLMHLEKNFYKILKHTQINIDLEGLINKTKVNYLKTNIDKISKITKICSYIRNYLNIIKDLRAAVKDKMLNDIKFIEENINKIIQIIVSNKVLISKNISTPFKQKMKLIRAKIRDLLKIKENFVAKTESPDFALNFRVNYENYPCLLNEADFNKKKETAFLIKVSYQFTGNTNPENIDLEINDTKFNLEESRDYDLRKQSRIKNITKTDDSNRNLRFCKSTSNVSELIAKDFTLKCPKSEAEPITMEITIVIGMGNLII